MMGMGFGLLGFLIMLLFWGGLIFGAVWLAKAIFQSGSVKAPPIGADADRSGRRPKEILDQRYARGEITREQYEMMKRDLGL